MLSTSALSAVCISLLSALLLAFLRVSSSSADTSFISGPDIPD